MFIAYFSNIVYNENIKDSIYEIRYTYIYIGAFKY